MVLVDLTGKQYGRLTVVIRSSNTGDGKARWLCECDCGKFKIMSRSNLKSAKFPSCGCASSELRGIEGIKLICKTCGHEWHPLKQNPKCCPSCVSQNWNKDKYVPKSSRLKLTYYAWNDMKGRCEGKIGRSRHRYAGRGITFCDRWKSFDNFVSDMGLKPDGMQLDREDNNGNYDPSNCRWVTSLVNNNNRSDNRLFNLNGETHTMAEMARLHGLEPRMLRVRLNRGWSLSRSLGQKIRGKQ